MSQRKVLVVGYGKRVREAALPSLAACEGLSLARIVARRAREEDGHAIGALEDLTDLAGVDVVYLAVGKDATPKVLARLVELGAADVELLVETPVVRFKHFRHVSQLARFRRTSVAEDCAYLPWFDTVEAASAHLGAPRTLTLDRSAYAYHGLATAKALLGASRVRGGRRRAAGEGRHERRLSFAGGTAAVVLEPRDYAVGRWTLEGERGALSDDGRDGLHLEARLEDGLVAGFRAGDFETSLTPAERGLTAGDPEGASVTARQEAMKRVGFLRIWERLARGEGGYPLAEGLDDMVVDYHLEKLGRYVANPFTSPRSPLARLLLSTVTRLGG